MKIRFTQDYGNKKAGDVVSISGHIAAQLVKSGAAIFERTSTSVVKAVDAPAIDEPVVEEVSAGDDVVENDETVVENDEPVVEVVKPKKKK
jgi:hypothetical protein